MLLPRWIKTQNCLSFLLAVFFAIYLMAMVIYPVVHGDWEYVLSVWYRWQGLNVGVLAFTSSIIFFYAAKFNSKKQREREFIAAKAFLPQAVNELISFHVQSIEMYKKVWAGVLHIPRPIQPTKYRDVFRNCIRHSDNRVGDILTDVLVSLQVQMSISDMVANNLDRYDDIDKSSVVYYIFDSVRLLIVLDKVFNFTNKDIGCIPLDLSSSDFEAMYRELEINPSEYIADNGEDLNFLTSRYVITGC